VGVFDLFKISKTVKLISCVTLLNILENGVLTSVAKTLTGGQLHLKASLVATKATEQAVDESVAPLAIFRTWIGVIMYT